MSPLYQTTSPYVCHCLKVTEDDLAQAVDDGLVRSVLDARSCTGAGDGCTACHRRIIEFLKQRSQGNPLA